METQTNHSHQTKQNTNPIVNAKSDDGVIPDKTDDTNNLKPQSCEQGVEKC